MDDAMQRKTNALQKRNQIWKHRSKFVAQARAAPATSATLSRNRMPLSDNQRGAQLRDAECRQSRCRHRVLSKRWKPRGTIRGHWNASRIINLARFECTRGGVRANEW